MKSSSLFSRFFRRHSALRTRKSAISTPKSPIRPSRRPLHLESLERRELLAGVDITISDASAIEGSDHLKFLDRFVQAESGGLLRPRAATFGPDGNGDG